MLRSNKNLNCRNTEDCLGRYIDSGLPAYLICSFCHGLFPRYYEGGQETLSVPSEPSDTVGVDSVLSAIRQEMTRQDQKWGEQNHSPEIWCTILGEEYGEVCKAALENNSDEYETELVQVAAVAVQAVLSYRRNRSFGKLTGVQDHG